MMPMPSTDYDRFHDWRRSHQDAKASTTAPINVVHPAIKRIGLRAGSMAAAGCTTFSTGSDEAAELSTADAGSKLATWLVSGATVSLTSASVITSAMAGGRKVSSNRGGESTSMAVAVGVGVAGGISSAGNVSNPSRVGISKGGSSGSRVDSASAVSVKAMSGVVVDSALKMTSVGV